MILRDARLFDGREEVTADGAIRMDPESGLIEAVGDAEPQGEESVLSLSGHTILPGLVDAHVHFSLSGQATVEDVVGQSDAELTLSEVKNARTTLESGVTSVRAMGARDLDVVLKRAIDRGDVPGPRTLANCRSITITGGHGHHLGREVDGPTECRRAVREQVKQGAGFIKFMATGGVTTPGTDPETLAFTREELEALIDEAHRRGVHVATHAHGAEGIKAAAAAGVDTVEHGTFMDEEAIDMLVTNDVTLVPTLSAPYRIARNAEQATEESSQKTSNVYERHIESFKRAYEAGVNIAGGTDVGTPFNYHGTNSTEISFMVEHGMSEAEAIEAMTASAADVVGLDVGVLEPGKYADLLVVEGNPLEDVSLLREPTAVLKGGAVVAGELPDGE
ncbi:metal-dependent hydrolase family protein [Halalkalicoccus jeotgali]|uniref:Amidohydrolase n=1 Tax=Halalkalicoccus jeotgali (strain DSM 18796 / CECT 7217 / JCM 14584 / KCTC 4019 / B3) TaxID=795797 RepID=D8JAK7_HALJB|nr:amidohydrolase family protein [Halalkalicoccus jeotgali]ADJ14729.1 amidohydrolase [Halalkalicoccus jeotgali B3]ELY39311.1 amidohydrolase [Halalkalicoccus jeotgali B3]